MYNNPYFSQPQRFQSMDNLNNQFSSNQYIHTMAQPNIQSTLLGKSVESIDIVRVMDIPLDGSTSYFPLTDGSAIVTKKLLSDGTSKTVIYKPVEDVKPEVPAYATMADLEDLKKELNEIKDKLKED